MSESFNEFADATMKYLKTKGVNVGDDYWNFIELNYGGSSYSESVLMVDLIDRFFSGELVDKKDIEFIKGIGTEEEIREYRDKIEERLFFTALYECLEKL